VKKEKIKKEKIKKEHHVKKEKKNKPHHRSKDSKEVINPIYPESEKRAQALKEESGSDSELSSDEQVSFKPSGNLKKGTIFQKNGIDRKYLPPKEKARPISKFRMYVFKDGSEKRVLHLHRRDHFLFGRDPKICDISLHHISVSHQHAVLQYRSRRKKTRSGRRFTEIVPYLIDLDSRHGTKINGDKIVASKYYQLLSKDVVQFGLSTREYIFILQDEVKIDYNKKQVKVVEEKKVLTVIDDAEENEENVVELKPEKPEVELKDLEEEDLWDL